MGKTNKTPGLGDRMKDYENVNRFYLTRRMPLIIRIGHKNRFSLGHSTKKCEKNCKIKNYGYYKLDSCGNIPEEVI